MKAEWHRKVWVKSGIERRGEHGASSNLLKELRVEVSLAYRNILRLSCTNFDDLLQMVDVMLKIRYENENGIASSHKTENNTMLSSNWRFFQVSRIHVSSSGINNIEVSA
ncbi:hypothetical protein JTB14_026765 [Gonioctena quinquepunctata]|nr:hypothetical protein JTB14_026765 [Gonioctena quinquepunctata]